MAGFMAGLAEGVKQGLDRLERQEAREQELAFKKAQAASAKRRFELQHELDKKKHLFEQKKYALEEFKRQKERRNTGMLELIKSGLVDPDLRYDFKVDPDATGDTDYTEERTMVRPDVQKTLDYFGLPADYARAKFEKEQIARSGTNLKILIDGVKNGEIHANDAFLENNPKVLEYFKRIGVAPTPEAFKKYSNNKVLQFSQTSILDKNKNNLGHTYRGLFNQAVLNKIPELTYLNIPPIMEDKKEIPFNDQAIQDIDNNPELPARLYMVINGALSNAAQKGEDHLDNVKNTLRQSKKLMSHLRQTRKYFKENPYIGSVGGDRQPLGIKYLSIAKDLNNFLDEKPDASSASSQVSEEPAQQQPKKPVAVSESRSSLEKVLFDGVTKTAYETIEPQFGSSSIGEFSKHPRYVNALAYAKFSDWGNDPLTSPQKRKLQQLGMNPDDIQRFSDPDVLMNEISDNFLEYAIAENLTDKQIQTIAPSLVSLNWLYYDKDDNTKWRSPMKEGAYAGDKQRPRKLLEEISNVRKAQDNVQDLLVLLNTNAELVANLKKEGNHRFVRQITQKVSTGTVFLQKAAAEFETLGKYLFGDNEEDIGFVGKDLEDIEIKDANGRVIGSVQKQLQIKMNQHLKDNKNTFINKEQKDLYARIQLQKVRLAYQLAGAFQGGGSGSRTISDQDFSIIMEAVWANNDADVASKLNELNHSLSRQLTKKQLQYKLEGNKSRLTENISDRVDKFSRIFYAKFREAVDDGRMAIQERSSSNLNTHISRKTIELPNGKIFSTLELDSRLANFDKKYIPLLQQRTDEALTQAKNIPDKELNALESGIRNYYQFRLRVYDQVFTMGKAYDAMVLKNRKFSPKHEENFGLITKLREEDIPHNERVETYYKLLEKNPELLKPLSQDKDAIVSYNQQEQEERFEKVLKTVAFIDFLRNLKGKQPFSKENIDTSNSSFEFDVTIENFANRIGVQF